MIVAASFDIQNPENWYNRAWQYGDGLFETMRFQSGVIPLWSFHQRRLIQSLSKLCIEEPDWEMIEQAYINYAVMHKIRSAVIKLTVFRSGQERGYQANSQEPGWLLSCHPMGTNHQPDKLQLGVANSRLSRQTILAGLKHLSRLEQVMIASELTEQPDVDDLLVLDAKERVIETTYQNVVLIKENQLITPKLKKSGVKGVALSWLKSKFKVKSKNLKLKNFKDYDAVLVCNAIRGFRMVESIINDQDKQSFLTSHQLHDKISIQWQLMFS
ncbi:MAG: aminodeoxychorismate lyase [Xanthomonadales bacterium]|nr:aminodeoxychorismate lyase [Xanthomonadales bacterium]